ncbi:MAG: CARDB domain-containing protein, partial [Planctomycetia bacterium]|nr:CARDB domain-containing protein [Planctomycetia bacterium]
VSVPQSPSSSMQPLPGQPQAVAAPSSAPAQAAKAPETGSFIVTNSSPLIDIKTSGPKRIVVGQESVFQIHVRNAGTVPAEKMVVSTEIPAWVEIANIAPSRGNSSLSPERKSNDAVICQWRLDLLAPGRDEILTMRLIPRQRNNFELASQYDFEQSAMKAGIEVQEPLIELAIDGRDQIEWGAEDKYRLRVRNTGNGDATNLRLTVTTGDNQQVTHPLGLLKAGEERTMELAVKTHVEDKVNIRIDAAGDYGLSASTSKSITVLRGKIDVYAEVPELQFVNNSVDCLVRVANIGTAPLQNVKVAVALPSEMKMLSCTGEGQLEPDKGQVVWTIPSVTVGQEIVHQMTCQMVAPGMGRLNVAASDATGQSAVSDAAIQIEAIASLRVDIKSPSGPIPVGSPIVYEVTVRNDGTRAARDVSAVLFLSKALCPTDVEHGAGVVSPIDGKVVFNRIGILGPGQSTSYKVTAQVAAPGNHKVQAVLESGSESIQLASEAMTYCYEKRTVARRDRENKANVPMTAQAPAPVQGTLQTTPERVALQPTPRPLPQVNPLAAPVGLPRPVDNTPASVKPTETKAAKPVNNPLLLTPFPTSSMPTTSIVAPTNNMPVSNAP